ncbi:Tab2/Atab2 family RNA-binding protein [Prochlorococcus marinus]|uniref:DUF1092 domain-containing protein n=1 Tax=Prochlorococcus marinus (strain MIT 9211) TaxID=93059 RepID=A9BEF3_PROM4|nr:Tab2/Atab2 family RNA-binding protein [Prochlorococcus marinus]ABX08463.1 conserved hypothetical protein [Prochlorococcus marinus str. MIT 9211]
MTVKNAEQTNQADWELDFYSRPVIEADGKKRWELLISSTENLSGKEPFRWEKKCPANEVNSIWLSKALKEALKDAQSQGWGKPKIVRCWRAPMKTMIKKAAESLGLEVKESRRTYSLLDWLAHREKEVYPLQSGYLNGPIAPPPARILNQPTPLPEAIRGDALSFASLEVRSLREAREWPIEFQGLLPIAPSIEENISIPGLRLFSKNRAFALSAWLSGLEPVKLIVEKNQLILEAGQEDRWLVTDMPQASADNAKKELSNSRENANGLQFISIQTSPNEQKFSGFWMLRDLGEN